MSHLSDILLWLLINIEHSPYIDLMNSVTDVDDGKPKKEKSKDKLQKKKKSGVSNDHHVLILSDLVLPLLLQVDCKFEYNY